MKKWLKRIALAGVAFVLIAWGVGAWVLHESIAVPPPLPADISIIKAVPEQRGEKTYLGKSWVGRREGLLVIHIKGTPFELGYAQGVLLRDQMHTLENEFIDMIHGYVPQEWKVQILKDYVIYRNRHLSDYVPLDYRVQILGTTLGNPDSHPEQGPYYNRLLNYHAAHDVSYMLIDNPIISHAGCTAFGAWGAATTGGHLITARNFDWEAAEVFSRDRVVIMCEPDQGIPFISVSWAGMAGVVSGMNRAGVSVTINGAPSRLPGKTATPVAIVAREVLQNAHNLTEALAIIRQSEVFVSTLWLVGSRGDGKCIVVEKTPAGTQVREPENNVIVCANHFQTTGFRDDQRNQDYIEEGTSISRYGRLAELIQNSRGKIDAARAVDLLRDRDLPGGQFPGNGHRGSLNAFIATHATVMDLTDGIFLAASPPNQFGKFVAFDVNDFDHELPGRALPADAVLASGEFDREREARKCMAESKRDLKNHDAQSALAQAEKAEKLNPGFYQNAEFRGRALMALGRNEEAAKAFETALAEHPAFLKETKALEDLLRRMRAAK